MVIRQKIENLNNSLMELNTHFKYGDKVKVIRGFYKGAVGKIISANQEEREQVYGIKPYEKVTQIKVIMYLITVGTKEYPQELWILEKDLKKVWFQ